MTALYESMFLIDNDLVRAGWADAKAIATDLLTKHGSTIKTVRRWDERQLAYPVKGRRRATYLLAYHELPHGNMDGLLRDLEITDGVLRYLHLRVDAVPEGETELSEAELSADFVVPEPPDDDVEPEPEESEESDEEGEGEAKAEGGDKPAEKAPADASAESSAGAASESTEAAAPATAAPAGSQED